MWICLCMVVNQKLALEAEAGEATGESVRPLALLRLSRAMLGRLWAPEGGIAPDTGLKAGMQSDSARLDATERLGEEPARRASNSICSKIARCCGTCHDYLLYFRRRKSHYVAVLAVAIPRRREAHYQLPLAPRDVRNPNSQQKTPGQVSNGTLLHKLVGGRVIELHWC